MTVDLAMTRFPYLVQNRNITVVEAKVVARTKTPTTSQFAVAPGLAPPDLTQSIWTGQSNPGPWTIATDFDPKLIEDVFVILEYSVK